MNTIPTYDTVVVGGGVAGMYTAWQLRLKGQNVALFELSQRWGGRIETIMMGGRRFKAEFGPMRYEEKGQPELLKLVRALKLSFSPFPAYQSAQAEFPQYQLDAEEARWNKRPLDLMLMGILRLLGKYRNGMTKPQMQEEVRKLVAAGLQNLRATARYEGKLLWKRGFWNALSDVLSHQAVLKIRDTGNFYHLLPDNPNAIEWMIFWLRGLDPDDRLVGIKGGSKMISEGLERVLKETKVDMHLEHRLVSLEQQNDGLVHLDFVGQVPKVRAKNVVLALPKAALRALETQSSKGLFPAPILRDLGSVIPIPLLKCFFVTDEPWWDELTQPQTRANTMPSREVHYYQEHSLQLREDRHAAYREALNRRVVHPLMYEEFLAAGIRLEREQRVMGLGKLGWRIHSHSDRQSFFVRAADFSVFNRKGWGMVMVYTDRPATEYWNDYIKDKENHGQAELNGDERLKNRFVKFLARRLQAQMEALRGTLTEAYPDVPEPECWATYRGLDLEALEEKMRQAVKEFGIHDWGRAPHGAACHTWRPNEKSWEVMDRMKAFRLKYAAPNGRGNIHICGEAYSEYQGFIEGSLSSSNAAIAAIVGNEN